MIFYILKYRCTKNNSYFATKCLLFNLKVYICQEIKTAKVYNLKMNFHSVSGLMN